MTQTKGRQPYPRRQHHVACMIPLPCRRLPIHLHVRHRSSTKGTNLGGAHRALHRGEARNGCDDAYLFDDGVQFNPALTPQGFPAES